MQTFVTGATGMLGSHVCRRLLKAAHDVTALVRAESNRAALEGLNVRYVEGALPGDADALKSALAGKEWIFHCAAMVDDWADRDVMYDVNVNGLKALLDAADRASLKRFVYVSSMAVLGMDPQVDLDESAPYVHTGDNYNYTKIEAEKLALEYAANGYPIAIVRPPYIYGPYDRQFFPRVVGALKAGVFKYIGDGSSPLSLVYAENLADAMLLAAQKDEAVGEVLMITDGEPVTRRELVEAIADGLGLAKPTKCVPAGLAKALCPVFEFFGKLRKKTPILNRFRLKFMMTPLTFKIDKAKRVLGYEPIPTSEGLARTIKWHEAHSE